VVAAAQSALGGDLRSLVLYGSAAEGQLRATSDVNLLFVLRRFDCRQVDPIREPLRQARAAVRATAMFVLDSELPAAMEEFAVKFGDIARRRRVLCGEDVFAGLKPSPEAKRRRIRQTMLNLEMRLRERYALTSLREEQLAVVIAEAAAPLRAAAAALLELEGSPTGSPRQALETVAQRLGQPGWQGALQRLSEARQQGSLPPGTASPTLVGLMDLAGQIRQRVETLKPV